MRTAEVDILIIPGWSSSGEDHWQSRWERNLKTARRVEQADWINPDRKEWVEKIERAIATCGRPVILVAHSLGVIAAVHALAGGKAHDAKGQGVKGAFLVAPADVDNAQHWPLTQGLTFDPSKSGFAPIPHRPLPCPSVLVASANDPYCTPLRARALAKEWGSQLMEAGEVGHINAASGHGPWPDGLLQLGLFLRKLSDHANAEKK